MYKSAVHAVFANYHEGGSAIQSLIDAEVAPGKISVIGEDSDAFRQATASLQSHKINTRIVWMGLIGAVLGSLAGFMGMPALTYVVSPVMSAMSAVIVGLVLGCYTGIAIGGMMLLDTIPPSEAHFNLAKLNQGVMAVSVVANGEDEMELVKRLISEQACNLSIDLDSVTAYGAPLLPVA